MPLILLALSDPADSDKAETTRVRQGFWMVCIDSRRRLKASAEQGLFRPTHLLESRTLQAATASAWGV